MAVSRKKGHGGEGATEELAVQGSSLLQLGRSANLGGQVEVPPFLCLGMGGQSTYLSRKGGGCLYCKS